MKEYHHKVMNGSALHVSQLLQPIDGGLFELEADGPEGGRTVIECRPSKSGVFIIAYKATEYCVEDEPEFREWENEVDVVEAIENCFSCVSNEQVYVRDEDTGRDLGVAVNKVGEDSYVYPVLVNKDGKLYPIVMNEVK